MPRDLADTSVPTIYGEPVGEQRAVCARSDAGGDETITTAGNSAATTRFQITSADEVYLVDVYWPASTVGAQVAGPGPLPESWEAEFWSGELHPLGWFVLRVPLGAVVVGV